MCKEHWKAFYVENEQLLLDGETSSLEELIKRSYPYIDVEVPGNFHRDLYLAGRTPDPYYADEARRDPCLYKHIYYYTYFDFNDEPNRQKLVLEGIDTVSDIYINGSFAGHTENMFITHELDISKHLQKGKNLLLIHISPVAIEARKYPLTLNEGAFKYNYASLNIRKAAHSFGWDIAPRLLSGGIWRPIYIKDVKAERITQLYGYTMELDKEKNTAELCFLYDTKVLCDDISRYSIHIHGKCGSSEFEEAQRLWHTGGKIRINVNEPLLWYPKNYGEPNLYDIEATLYKDGDAIDTVNQRIGIRTAELIRTSLTDENASGEFCFVINSQKVFCMGTNWVPVDALHANDRERIPEILNMISDLGCNIIRMWGGGVYEDDLVYDYCDEHGIMIWQDFMMGCAIYPQNEGFCAKIKEEAESVVKRLRHHPSIIAWAGDNENDIAYLGWFDKRRDPNQNILTRKIIPDVLKMHDFTRPYLPSSPYVDEVAYESEYEYITEDHLWGPRDYFKGKYYSGSLCHFASETGYHGCPSPSSLARFIPSEHLWGETGDEFIQNDHIWLAHATAMENGENDPYTYRLPLMCNQVKTLFGTSVPNTLTDFAKASQISQAEAVKYFIERFRIAKWHKTGIIWWNVMDCWPQISDAVVDYYFTKKLAYHYIKRSQTPICIIADQEEGLTKIYCVNDTQECKSISYKLTDAKTNQIIASGDRCIKDNVSELLEVLPSSAEARYLIMELICDGKKTTNHFVENIKEIDYSEYMSFIQKQGYANFEGFD